MNIKKSAVLFLALSLSASPVFGGPRIHPAHSQNTSTTYEFDGGVIILVSQDGNITGFKNGVPLTNDQIRPFVESEPSLAALAGIQAPINPPRPANLKEIIKSNPNFSHLLLANSDPKSSPEVTADSQEEIERQERINKDFQKIRSQIELFTDYTSRIQKSDQHPTEDPTQGNLTSSENPQEVKLEALPSQTQEEVALPETKTNENSDTDNTIVAAEQAVAEAAAAIASYSSQENLAEIAPLSPFTEESVTEVSLPAPAPVAQTEEAAAAPVTQTEKAAAAPVTQTEKAAAAPVTQTEEAAAAPVDQADEASLAPVAAPIQPSDAEKVDDIFAELENAQEPSDIPLSEAPSEFASSDPADLTPDNMVLSADDLIPEATVVGQQETEKEESQFDLDDQKITQLVADIREVVTKIQTLANPSQNDPASISTSVQGYHLTYKGVHSGPARAFLGRYDSDLSGALGDLLEDEEQDGNKTTITLRGGQKITLDSSKNRWKLSDGTELVRTQAGNYQREMNALSVTKDQDNNRIVQLADGHTVKIQSSFEQVSEPVQLTGDNLNPSALYTVSYRLNGNSYTVKASQISDLGDGQLAIRDIDGNLIPINREDLVSALPQNSGKDSKVTLYRVKLVDPNTKIQKDSTEHAIDPVTGQVIQRDLVVQSYRHNFKDGTIELIDIHGNKRVVDKDDYQLHVREAFDLKPGQHHHFVRFEDVVRSAQTPKGTHFQYSKDGSSPSKIAGIRENGDQFEVIGTNGVVVSTIDKDDDFSLSGLVTESRNDQRKKQFEARGKTQVVRASDELDELHKILRGFDGHVLASDPVQEAIREAIAANNDVKRIWKYEGETLRGEKQIQQYVKPSDAASAK